MKILVQDGDQYQLMVLLWEKLMKLYFYQQMIIWEVAKDWNIPTGFMIWDPKRITSNESHWSQICLMVDDRETESQMCCDLS